MKVTYNYSLNASANNCETVITTVFFILILLFYHTSYIGKYVYYIGCLKKRSGRFFDLKNLTKGLTGVIDSFLTKLTPIKEVETSENS